MTSESSRYCLLARICIMLCCPIWRSCSGVSAACETSPRSGRPSPSAQGERHSNNSRIDFFMAAMIVVFASGSHCVRSTYCFKVYSSDIDSTLQNAQNWNVFNFTIWKMDKIGKYEIVRELGTGATSTVYLADRSVQQTAGRHQAVRSGNAARPRSRQDLSQAADDRGIAGGQVVASAYRKDSGCGDG